MYINVYLKSFSILCISTLNICGLLAIKTVHLSELSLNSNVPCFVEVDLGLHFNK